MPPSQRSQRYDIDETNTKRFAQTVIDTLGLRAVNPCDTGKRLHHHIEAGDES